MAPGADRCGAAPRQEGHVGHCANHAHGPRGRLLEPASRYAGADCNEQMFTREVPADLPQHLRNVLGLHGDDQHGALVGHRYVVVGGADSKRPLEEIPPLGRYVRCAQ